MIDNLFSNSPRGIRNNNWLNIKYNPRNHWKGQIGNDGTFCIFSEPVFGIRAAYKILKSYLKRKPDLTLKEFIYQWSATDREHYLAFIVRSRPVFNAFYSWTPLFVFTSSDIVCLFHLMAIYENGLQYKDSIDFKLIQRGVSLK